MACYHPVTAWMSFDPSTGNRRLVFGPIQGQPPIQVACGRCIGCRLERSRQWAVRCVHEASLYANNSFVTLTYGDSFLPAFGTLVPEDLQKFMKRLRKKFGAGIRFFACGEYGEDLGRPHYHICLFNHDFPDKVYWRKTDRGDHIYRSTILEELWPFGQSEFGAVSFESAAYVARYCVDKVNGEEAKFIRDDGTPGHYARLDVSTGEIVNLVPEFVRMSLGTHDKKGGIGKGWFDKFESDVYPSDFVVMRGRKMKPPKFYDRLRQAKDELLFYDVHLKARHEFALANEHDSTPERLAVREACKLSQMSTLKRRI